jgi:purine-nucleoside phosphorylase
MTTPHINAPANAFAKTMLFPGDPLRAKYIAENFLEDAKLVTDVRNMLGYTGFYQGTKLSVMGHGMGIPSLSIYAKELITEYGVENIIRIGSCGAVRQDIKVLDLVVAMGACTDSKVNRTRFGQHDFAAIADYGLLSAWLETAQQAQVPVHVGNIHTTDLFYSPETEIFDTIEKMGVLAVDMEAAGLYGVASEFGAKALCVLTVSDHIRTGEQVSAAERETTFHDMMQVTLQAAVKIEQQA